MDGFLANRGESSGESDSIALVACICLFPLNLNNFGRKGLFFFFIF